MVLDGIAHPEIEVRGGNVVGVIRLLLVRSLDSPLNDHTLAGKASLLANVEKKPNQIDRRSQEEEDCDFLKSTNVARIDNLF